MEIGADGRYDSILQPLRDIEQIWKIDLAGTLQQYVAEVASVTIEMGSRVLNFAQAAMMLMQASMLISKKVDALRELVQDTYDLIMNRGKQAEEKDGKRGRRRRVIVREPVKFTDEAATPSLLPVEKRMKADVTNTLRWMLVGMEPGGSRASEGLRIAEGELVPFEDTQTGTMNYRLSGVCSWTNAGLLLPNVRHELPGGVSLVPEPVPATPAGRKNLRCPPTPGSVTAQRLSLVGRAPSAAAEELDEAGFDQVLDDAMAGGDDTDTEDTPVRPTDPQVSAAPDDGDEEEYEVDEYELLMEKSQLDRFAVTLPDKPWALYDIRKKRLPADPSKSVMQSMLSEKMTCAKFAQCRRVDSLGKVVWDSDKIARMGPAIYQDLTEVMQKAKDRLRKEVSKDRKQRLWLQKQRSSTVASTDCAPSLPRASVVHEREPSAAPTQLHVDDDDGGFGEETFEEEEELEAKEWVSQPRKSLSQISLERGIYTEDTEEGRLFYESLAKYDELLFAHNLAATEKQANLTREEVELHNKVSEWSTMVEPLLDEQLGRSTFDIYKYAQLILETFGDGTVISFADLAKRCEAPWELPRYFLAMLQLSNNGNVRLEIERLFDGARSDGIIVNLLTREHAFAFEAADEEAFARGHALAQQNDAQPSISQISKRSPDPHPAKRRRRAKQSKDDALSQETVVAP